MNVYKYEGQQIDVATTERLRTIKGINHRGYCDEYPENTLPAFIGSYKHGFRYVECDVGFTSDDVPVLLHDAYITRTSNGSGLLSDFTFEQVRTKDFGAWKGWYFSGTKIPSLEEFIILCRKLGLHPYIEIKNNETYTQAKIQTIVNIVDAYGMKGDVTYISFSKDYLGYVAAYDPHARLGYIVSTTVDATVISDAVALRTGQNDVFLDSDVYDASVIELCKEAGLPLEIWTIDSRDTIESLDDYITGVTSNNKDASIIKMKKVLSDYKIR